MKSKSFFQHVVTFSILYCCVLMWTYYCDHGTFSVCHLKFKLVALIIMGAGFCFYLKKNKLNQTKLF